MLESNIAISTIYEIEPGLRDLIEESEISAILPQAKDRLISIIGNELPKRKDLINLCKHLDLSTTVKEDTVGRRRIVLNYNGESATYKLEAGLSETSLDEVASYPFTQSEIIKGLLPGMWKYYKLSLVDGSGELIESYLVEDSFELPHTYLTLSMVYKRLQSLVDDSYSSKADYYRDLFSDTINSLQYSFDSDEDGEITDEDVGISSNSTNILL